jgi:hypothetical protein
MWLLIQQTYTKKSPKKNLSLVMGPSQIVLGMVISMKTMMHNNKNLWRCDFVCCQNLQGYSIVESQWLKRLVMHQNPQSAFSNYKQMVQHSISSLVVKTID